jgi:GNAT superfamily N-acetyltransferase
VVSSRRGLEIRAAQAADAAGLCELLASAGLGVAQADLAARIEAMRLGTGTILIALEWGPPSGVVALHWFGRLDAGKLAAQIDFLLVGAEDRRRGIGRLLVKAASQAARVAGCGSLELAARPEQAGMHAFCSATGFIPLGARYERALRKATGD